jgi:hypothetical protein
LVKALARAWRWQRMMDEGVYATVSEIGEAEGIDKGYVSRILRLALLPPDHVERILKPGKGTKLDLSRLLKTFAAQWDQQRKDLLLRNCLEKAQRDNTVRSK